MYEKFLNNNKLIYTILIITLIIVSFPLYSNTNLIYGHDTIFHLERIESIAVGLNAGNFPVNLYPYMYNGYGYPAGYFYPDLFLYIPAILIVIGLDTVTAYNLFLFAIIIFGAIIACISFEAFFKSLNIDDAKLYGYVAGSIYAGCFYRLLDIYIRAAIGEALAMCFAPFALVSFYLTIKNKKNAWIGVVISFSCILQSHILSSLMIFCAYILMCICFFKTILNKEILSSLLKIIFFIIILNIWKYAPFISMYECIDFHMKSHVKSANDILLFTWNELLTYHFFTGYLPLLIIFIYTICKIIKRNITNLDYIFFLCVFISILLIIGMSESAPIQFINQIPLIGEKIGIIQFAYRITMFTSVFISIAISIAICQNKKILYTIFLVFFISAESINFFCFTEETKENNALIIHRPENMVVSDLFIYLKGTVADNIPISSLNIDKNSNMIAISLGHDDYLYKDINLSDYRLYNDEKTKEYWETVKNQNLLKLDTNDYSPKEVIKNFSRNGLNLNFTTISNEDVKIKLPLWYYPKSYKAECDGNFIGVFEVYHHRLAITVPKGEHNIKVYPALSAPHRNACLISILGLIIFIIYCKKNYGNL